MRLENLFGLIVANKGPIERWREQFGFLLCSRTCCMRWCHILLRLLLMKTSILLLLDSSSVICLWVTYPSVTHVFAYRINYWPSISAYVLTYFLYLEKIGSQKKLTSNFMEWNKNKLETTQLKYEFCNKSFWKDEPLTSWALLQHICPHFWAWLL